MICEQGSQLQAFAREIRCCQDLLQTSAAAHYSFEESLCNYFSSCRAGMGVVIWEK